MKRLHEEPLVFPIGDIEYVIPPVGITAGWELTTRLAMDPDEAMAEKVESDHLFKLALTPEIWEQMRADGVPLYLAFRAGMSALAHFTVLSQGGTPEDAKTAAEAIWESGIRPELLAAWVAAKQESLASSTTSRRTAGAKSSTKPRANTSGTRTSRARPKAAPSTG